MLAVLALIVYECHVFIISFCGLFCAIELGGAYTIGDSLFSWSFSVRKMLFLPENLSVMAVLSPSLLAYCLV